MVEQQQSLVRTRRRSVNAKAFTNAAGVATAGGFLAIYAGTALGLAIGIPVVALAFGGLIARAKRRARRFNVENQVANDALNRGELGKAHEVWDYWGDIRDNKQIRVIACHNLATVWMHQSKHDEARKLHQENSEHYLKSLRRLGLTQLSAV